jgi:hypothetical protein
LARAMRLASRCVDALAELVVHRLLFAAPIGRANEDHGLVGFAVAGELDLDAVMDGAPAVCTSKFGCELLQFRLRRANDVAAAGSAQPCQVLGAGHAAVGDPHPPQHAVTRLHGGDDRLQGPRIVGVAGEHLVTQRKAVERHHQRDQDLLAVAAMIAGMAALGLRVGLRQAFEIGAGDVIEQHFIADREQFPAALRQMRFKRRLVRQQMIEAAIEAILVDLLIAQLKQIAQCRAAIPILRNVQLARRLAQARRHQHRRHLRPGNALLTNRQQPLAQLLKPDAAPQRQRQIHIAELARALDADALQANRHRPMFAAIIKKLRTLRGADQMPRQRPRFDAARFIEFAKMRHRLLNDPPSDPHAAHQPPIAANLAVLSQRRVAQIHGGESRYDPPIRENALDWHYMPKSAPRARSSP